MKIHSSRLNSCCQKNSGPSPHIFKIVKDNFASIGMKYIFVATTEALKDRSTSYRGTFENL